MKKSLALHQIQYYDFSLLDTSAISVYDFSKTLENYHNEDMETVQTDTDERGFVRVQWIQSRTQYQEQWSIDSLDIVLGVVGGFSGVVWSFLALIFGGYETFKFENSLIGAVYPTSPQDMPSWDDGADDEGGAGLKEQNAKRAMMRTVAERGKYFFNYSEYLVSLIIRSVCCCCHRGPWFKRRIKKLERHEAASQRLADEIDIIKLLSTQRIGQFMSKLVLKKYQRALVTNFSKY